MVGRGLWRLTAEKGKEGQRSLAPLGRRLRRPICLHKGGGDASFRLPGKARRVQAQDSATKEPGLPRSLGLYNYTLKEDQLGGRACRVLRRKHTARPPPLMLPSLCSQVRDDQPLKGASQDPGRTFFSPSKPFFQVHLQVTLIRMGSTVQSHTCISVMRQQGYTYGEGIYL